MGELVCVSTSDPAYGCSSTSCYPCVAPHVKSTLCRPDGTCAIGACFNGFNNCNVEPADGCEVNLSSDVHHCGACDNDCNALYRRSQV